MNLQEAIEAGRLTEEEVHAFYFDYRPYEGRSQSEDCIHALDKAAHAKAVQHVLWAVVGWLSDYGSQTQRLDNYQDRKWTAFEFMQLLQSLGISRPEL